MTEELKNRAWAAIPPEARSEARREYAFHNRKGKYLGGDVLANIFGHHNLTSDKEPEEMLTVPRTKIMKFYERYVRGSKDSTTKIDKALFDGKITLLETLFVDKCLPAPSEPKPTPAFKVGDKVVIVENGSVSEIDIIGNENKIGQYHVKYYGWFKPEDIIPYTEPELQERKLKPITEKVMVSVTTKEEESAIREILHRNGWVWRGGLSLMEFNYSLDIASARCAFELTAPNNVTWVINPKESISASEFKDKYLEPEPKAIPDCDTCAFEHHGSCERYIGCDGTPAWCDRNNEDAPCGDYKPRQTEEHMEDKELNLLTLLKDCEDEKFYMLTNGEVTFKGIEGTDCEGDVIRVGDKWNYIAAHILPDGKITPEGHCILYPSRALYEKHPLDAKSAWSEWAESRKPNRWRAKEREYFWTIDRDGCVFMSQDSYLDIHTKSYRFGNYFRTESEAMQAAEEVRKCLEQFHANLAEK